MHNYTSKLLLVAALASCGSTSARQDLAPAPVVAAQPVSAGGPASDSATGVPAPSEASISSAASPPRPAPKTAAERRDERLRPEEVARVWSYLPEGTELHGVTRLTSTEDGAIEALLVKTLVQGSVQAAVYVLDQDGRLLAQLPRASVAEPGVLRVGALQLPLEAHATLRAIECGELDLGRAAAVLRLAGLVAEERLRAASESGWEALESERDPDIELLGVSPEERLGANELPRTTSSLNPDEFEVSRLLPATLSGWRQLDGEWSGRVRIEVLTASGTSQVLVVGVSGQLPR
jgi:hypothetical protein